MGRMGGERIKKKWQFSLWNTDISKKMEKLNIISRLEEHYKFIIYMDEKIKMQF